MTTPDLAAIEAGARAMWAWSISRGLDIPTWDDLPPSARIDPMRIAEIHYAAMAPHIRKTVAEELAAAFRVRLAGHYLADIVCDHDRKQDNPICACSRVHLGWHPTVGAAVRAWIDHVIDDVREIGAKP